MNPQLKKLLIKVIENQKESKRESQKEINERKRIKNLKFESEKNIQLQGIKEVENDLFNENTIQQFFDNVFKISELREKQHIANNNQVLERDKRIKELMNKR